jgi:hypothetical protein
MPSSALSCGSTLLKAPLSTFDYVLYITDGINTVKVLCHKCVLLAHSSRMMELITNENFFDLEISVLPGYITSALELIQYMYLKDPSYVSDVGKVLQLCGMFHMSSDHFAIRNFVSTQPLAVTTQLNLYYNGAVENGNFINDFLPCINLKDFATVQKNKELGKSGNTRHFKERTIRRRSFRILGPNKTRSSRVY